MEDGVPQDSHGVHSVAVARDDLSWPLPADVTDMPGPSGLCRAMAHTQRNKACPDGLPGEMLKALPASFAALVMPLLLKLGLLGGEAVGLKGALLTWLYKHRGARNVCSSYRAIMLLPTLTKAIHRSLRPRLYEHVISQSPPLLLGGRRGASAVFGSHVTRAFHQWWCARKQPAASMYSLCRRRIRLL